MMTRQILMVSAGLGDPSSRRMLGDQVAEAVVAELEALGTPAVVNAVEVRNHALDIAKNFITGYPGPDLAAVLDEVGRADGLIVVSPVFSGSFSGLLKSVFDVLDQNVLHETPVLMGATGGSARHALMLEHAMRPLFSYLHAVVVPTAVYAAPEDWGGNSAAGPLEQRIRRAARELAAAVHASSRRADQARSAA
ncbi:NADPH-dependent FMN reductase [Arthrobacter sp. NamB2]|uniref:CE1759 family FMN reductase n=1 Tax=Arthrobacter sp. NamB2 TaxID=2576035 RepID=UPI0010CA0B3C|nr:CE1759 family FMN reductase [Arthrobacter sp. NamB2]TKV29153.1 NADPH-dependent FMN reductase [Arthrobacter sp. NamB2]